jgi:hypothetical protein
MRMEIRRFYTPQRDNDTERHRRYIRSRVNLKPSEVDNGPDIEEAMHESQQECTSSTRSKTETPSELVSHFSASETCVFYSLSGHVGRADQISLRWRSDAFMVYLRGNTAIYRTAKTYYLPERATCLISFKMHASAQSPSSVSCIATSRYATMRCRNLPFTDFKPFLFVFSSLTGDYTHTTLRVLYR